MVDGPEEQEPLRRRAEAGEGVSQTDQGRNEMKIIVMWLIVNSYSHGATIKEDQYGVMPQVYSVPSILLHSETREWRVKIFDSVEEADVFIAKAPPEVVEIHKGVLKAERVKEKELLK